MDKFLFSSRTSWSVLSNEISSITENLRGNGISIINLTETNPTHCDFAFYKEIDFLSIFSAEIEYQYHPVANGALLTRNAIAVYYRVKSLQVSPDHIFLTASSSESYSHILSLLCNVNDEILVPSPSYPLLEYICSLNDVEMKQYVLNYEKEWRIDFDSLQSNLNKRTKAIVIINPNNPTGSFLNEEEWNSILKIAEQNSCVIILDEVFADFSLDGFVPYPLHSNPNVLLFRLNGISKMLALPQWKLGWISVEGNNKLVKKVVDKLEIICDTFLSVNTAIQYAFPSLMKYISTIQSEILNRIQKNYLLLQNEFQNTAATVISLHGGWSAILRLPNFYSDEQWVKKIILEENVVTHPGYFYDFTVGSFIVISLLVQEDLFLQGIKRIKNYMEKAQCSK